MSGFEDHRNITHALGLSDGTVLTWSNSEMAAGDDKLRRWSVDGQPMVVFDTCPTDVLLLSDGSLISWSDRRDGHVLQRWASDGRQIATLQRGSRHHRVKVKGAFELSDGSIVSWAVSDAFGGEVMRFDPSGRELATFAPNVDSGSPKGATELTDGSTMVWSGMAYSNHREGFLNRWDADGSHLALFRGHEDPVEGARQLSDGSIVSWASDGTLRRWNIDGREEGILHKADCPSTLRGTLKLRDGSLLLWSDRKNVSGGASAVERIDLAAPPAAGRERHSSSANGLLGLDDGTVLSWADDGTLRRWGTDGEPLSALRIYTSGGIGGVRRLRDGSLLLWTSLLDPPKLDRWSIDGKQLVVFERHRKDIDDALELSDDSILSWSRGGYSGATMRLSDIEGHSLATFEAFGVVGAMELSDGTLLSWTSDSPATCGSLYHWDRSGNRLASVNHRTGVRGAIELPDGRILSWSGSIHYGKSELDNTLKLWDLRNSRCSLFGIPLVTFEDHRVVLGARWLPDGSIISWGDAVRRWSMDGRQIALFESGLYEDDRESLFAWAREEGFDPNVLYPETKEPYLGSTARVAVTSWGKIDVYCRFSGRLLSRFIADTNITCLGVLPGGVVAAGTDHGRVLFFRWTGEAMSE